MTVTPAPISYNVVFDANGRPVPGALVSCYQGGTTTVAPCYSDPAGTIPLPQPFTASGAGRIPATYLGPGVFRFRITTPQGAIVEDLDGVEGYVATTVNETVNQTVTDTPTGGLLPFYGSGAPAGWVRANGRTIGSMQSGASEFADASTVALYTALWNTDAPFGLLAVTGGRGSSAAADFNAGKALALPDLRRVGLIGVDGMGNGVKGGGLAFLDIGAVNGFESHQLVVSEMPSHTHVATETTAGAHVHPNSVTDQQGAHTHSYNYATYASDGGASTGTGPVRASQQTTPDTTGSAASTATTSPSRRTARTFTRSRTLRPAAMAITTSCSRRCRSRS